MIKLETHCHTYLSSCCADNDDNHTINKFIEAGYGGAVATNHFSKYVYENNLIGETHKEKIDSFFAFIDGFKKKCKNKGLKIYYNKTI